MIAADETSARPAHHREFQFLHRSDHVLAEAVLVRQRRARLEQAAVDLIVEMLDKATEEHRAVRL
jgi:uncharacterized protein (DUF1778 family)